MSLIIYCLNGPNLNLLGEREPAIYGKGTLADVKKLCEETVASLGGTLDFRQSNQEGSVRLLRSKGGGKDRGQCRY